MPSQFIRHFADPLTSRSPLATNVFPQTPPAERVDHARVGTSQVNETKAALHALLVSLPQSEPLTSSQIQNAISVLARLDESDRVFTATLDSEEKALRNAVVCKVVVGLYAEAMDTYLTQATQVEAESEWWTEIERSRWNTAYYLLQTAPARLYRLLETILSAIRSEQLPISVSLLSPSSLSRLFPTSPTSPFRPSALTTSLFPHLSKMTVTTSAFIYSPTVPLSFNSASFDKLTQNIFYYFNLIGNSISYPLTLTRQECQLKRQELEKIRNERAEILGQLAQMRSTLSEILTNPEYSYAANKGFLGQMQRFVEILDQKAAVDADKAHPSPVSALMHLSNETLPAVVQSHLSMLKSDRLLRPRRLVLIWPKIILLPPLALYACKSLYVSRTTLEQVATDAMETVKGFVKGWLVEPLRDVLKTVRSGVGDEGVLVRREGVMADLDSLERMTLTFARDELRYNDEQLSALSRQIRVGDLTPVMQVYEEDIRRPLRSAIGGTLLRNVFIQVQKAKVDIDQALTGIDHLLKSQELTFAFVGVAPALAIVYLAGGVLRQAWSGGRGRGRYGGVRKRQAVWDAMRRIERILITQPTEDQQVAALPSGLLLLSLARLRSYATDFLPADSRLRDGFLEDLDDLENPELGRDAKLEVIERMWRCWGATLGWNKCGEV